MTTTTALEHMLTTDDLASLPSLNEHPDVQTTRSKIQSAEQQLQKARARFVAAEAELTAAERGAAAGKRDERRMQAAATAKVVAESDVRIASHVLDNAKAACRLTYDSACVLAERALMDQHFALVRALDAKLEEARAINLRITALEETSERLFSGGPYRRREGLLGQPLQRLGWWREFGSTRGTVEDTRLGYWRAFWRKHAASLGYR